MTVTIFETVIISICCMIATSAVTFVFQKFRKLAKKEESMEKGMKVLLCDRITQSCAVHEKRGFIATYERMNLESMHSEYKNLGGNGAIDSIVKRILALPNFDQTEL